MRSSFVAQVSDELRDPLTVVRGVAGTLATHGPGLETSRRNRLFGDMSDQTDQLRRTIDALLDFSRFQSTRPDAVIEPVPLPALLDPLLLAIDADLVPGGWSRTTAVVVDAGLVRHAVELLVAGTGIVEAAPQLQVTETPSGVELIVRADSEASAAPALVRSLAAQLLVAAGAELDGTSVAPRIRLPKVGAAVAR
jgi:signal transduction histidine kinase